MLALNCHYMRFMGGESLIFFPRGFHRDPAPCFCRVRDLTYFSSVQRSPSEVSLALRRRLYCGVFVASSRAHRKGLPLLRLPRTPPVPPCQIFHQQESSGRRVSRSLTNSLNNSFKKSKKGYYPMKDLNENHTKRKLYI